jgi:hypothetical protein
VLRYADVPVLLIRAKEKTADWEAKEQITTA